jgi:hypothetical protein
MRTGHILGFLSALLLSGCTTASSKGKAAASSHVQPPQASFVIDPAPERGTWILRAFRQLDGHRAEGVIYLSSDITPSPDTPHTALAGSRAFLLLGQERLQAGDLPRAIGAAKQGIAELGRDYRNPTTVEHTSMRILLAEDEEEKGKLDKAAPRLLDALRARIRMYVSKHAPFVRLPNEKDEEPDRRRD